MHRCLAVKGACRIVWVVVALAMIVLLTHCARTSTHIRVTSTQSPEFAPADFKSFCCVPTGLCRTLGLTEEDVLARLSQKLSERGSVCDSIEPDAYLIAAVALDSIQTPHANPWSRREGFRPNPNRGIYNTSRRDADGRWVSTTAQYPPTVYYGKPPSFPPPTELHLNVMLLRMVIRDNDTTIVPLWEGSATGSCTEDNQASELQVLVDELFASFPATVELRERAYSWPPGRPEKRKLEKKEMTKVDESN